MNLKPQKNKCSFLKVYGELLFFLIFTRFAYQNDFLILGVAILLMVVIALYEVARIARVYNRAALCFFFFFLSDPAVSSSCRRNGKRI